MAENTVYLYPKTSCPCENCDDNKCEKPKGVRTNMSVRGCSRPGCMDCHNRVTLGGSIQPRKKHGWVQLNPQVYTDKFDPTFGKIACNQDKNCVDPSYISADPRLYSTTLGNYLPLDRPPINGNVQLNNIYNPKWDGYGQGYTPYSMIRDGQIEYYVDRSIEDAYFEPVFATKAKETAVLFVDPMGSRKPEYSRSPLVNTENPTVSTPNYYPDCLSFIQDTQSHREDLMSLQMRKRGQERWSTRWSQQD